MTDLDIIRIAFTPWGVSAVVIGVFYLLGAIIQLRGK